MLMELMGLHLPGASFVNPDTPLRTALTEAAARRRAVELETPIADIVDEQAVVNGVVALLATGGSTNHTMHLVAMARAAGIDLRWDDFADLSAVVPLLARIYPNGKADINHFHAAGGTAFLVRELVGAGLMHRRRADGRRARAATLHDRADARRRSADLARRPDREPRPRRCCARSTTRSTRTAACACWRATSAAR